MLNRNEICWCGSGLKYKKCHMDFDEKLRELEIAGNIVPNRFIIKTPKEVEMIKKSAVVNTGILDHVSENIKAGMSTADIDKLVYDYTIEHDAIPATLDYEGYPKSCCKSINI